jgi:hypothetical protein
MLCLGVSGEYLSAACLLGEDVPRASVQMAAVPCISDVFGPPTLAHLR